MECPRCGEIELGHTRTDGDVAVYECPCGHEETRHEPSELIGFKEDAA